MQLEFRESYLVAVVVVLVLLCNLHGLLLCAKELVHACRELPCCFPPGCFCCSLPCSLPCRVRVDITIAQTPGSEDVTEDPNALSLPPSLCC